MEYFYIFLENFFLCSNVTLFLIVVLKGYIKTNFAEMRKMNQTIGCGSITDGKYKLEIHIINFNYKDYLGLRIMEGDKIEV